jgi:hypothetical protein
MISLQPCTSMLSPSVAFSDIRIFCKNYVGKGIHIRLIMGSKSQLTICTAKDHGDTGTPEPHFRNLRSWHLGVGVGVVASEPNELHFSESRTMDEWISKRFLNQSIASSIESILYSTDDFVRGYGTPISRASSSGLRVLLLLLAFFPPKDFEAFLLCVVSCCCLLSSASLASASMMANFSATEIGGDLFRVYQSNQ